MFKDEVDVEQSKHASPDPLKKSSLKPTGEIQTSNRKRKAPDPDDLFGWEESTLLPRKKPDPVQNQKNVGCSPNKQKPEDVPSQVPRPSKKPEPAESKLGSSSGNATTRSWHSSQNTTRPSLNTTAFLGKVS